MMSRLKGFVICDQDGEMKLISKVTFNKIVFKFKADGENITFYRS